MTRDEMKRSAARAAVEHVEPGSVVGVGTGSTANHFIDLLAEADRRTEAAVASSKATAARLRASGVRVVELDDVGQLPLYVDGADEADGRRRLIKGGGGALTREKVVARSSTRFICIVDDSKLVARLGAFPLPVEVIPMACGLVAREIEKLGGHPRLREGFETDNGNRVLDVEGLDLADPAAVEGRLNQIPGVVTNGLFCRRPADLLLIGGERGVREI